MRQDLATILETDSGKRFFEQFLRDCNVTRPRFHSDPAESQFYEGRRHLAMSYLHLLGADDPQNLIDRLETENQKKRENT